MNEDIPDKDLPDQPDETQPEKGPILIVWKKRNFVVSITRYADNDNTCIVLLDPSSGLLELKVSVNLHKVPAHQVYVKDYSENRGIAAIMTANRLLRRTGTSIQNGSVEFELFDILPALAESFGIETPEIDLPEVVDSSLSQAIPNEIVNAGPQVASDEDVGEAAATMGELEAQQALNKVQENLDKDSDPPNPPTVT